MAIEFENPTTAGTVLVREAIQSQDYVAGTSGWRIAANGDVEFNSGTFRGTLTASDIIGSIFRTSLTDPSLIINEDNANSLRVYDAAGDLLCEIGANAGSNASAVFYDPSNNKALSIGQQIQWLQGSGILTQLAALYQTSTAVLLNTILSGGVAFDANHGALVHVLPGTDTLETWHAPTMGTGFATGPGGSGSYPPLKFRVTTEDSARVFGVFHTTTTTPGAVIASGFPVVNQSTLSGVGVVGSVLRFQGAIGTLACYLNNAGELRTANSLTYAVNDSFMINADIPLGNIA